MYLLDTNILIYVFNDISPYGDWFAKQGQQKQIHLSVVTIAEFVTGASGNELDKLYSIESVMPILPIDAQIAHIAGMYRKQLTQKIKAPYLIDCLIAATAKVHNLTLVTNNIKDFPMNDIKILDLNKK